MLLLLDHWLCLASVVVLRAHVVVVIRNRWHLRCHQKFELLVALFLMLLLLLQLSFFCRKYSGSAFLLRLTNVCDTF